MANLKMCVWCDDDGWDYNSKLIERFGDFHGGSFPRVCYATGGERTIFEEYELRLAEAYGLIEDEDEDEDRCVYTEELWGTHLVRLRADRSVIDIHPKKRIIKVKKKLVIKEDKPPPYSWLPAIYRNVVRV